MFPLLLISLSPPLAQLVRVYEIGAVHVLFVRCALLDPAAQSLVGLSKDSESLPQ
jgi:hypothetical protein